MLFDLVVILNQTIHLIRRTNLHQDVGEEIESKFLHTISFRHRKKNNKKKLHDKKREWSLPQSKNTIPLVT